MTFARDEIHALSFTLSYSAVLLFASKRFPFVAAWNNLFFVVVSSCKSHSVFLKELWCIQYLCLFLINRYRGYCPQLKYECGHTYGIATDKLTSVRETSLKYKYCFCLSLLNLTPQTIPRTVLELLHHAYIYTAFV